MRLPVIAGNQMDILRREMDVCRLKVVSAKRMELAACRIKQRKTGALATLRAGDQVNFVGYPRLRGNDTECVDRFCDNLR